MSLSREVLQSHLNDYQQKLKSLNSYIAELNARTAEHGTDRAHFEEDLREAEHNVAFYESEVARIQAELGGAGGGRGALGAVLPRALLNQGAGALVLSAICFAAGVLVGSRLLSNRGEQ